MVKSFSKESWFVFFLILVLSVGGLSYLDEEAKRGTMFERYSSLRAEPDGTLGFYELSKALGKDTQRWKKPLFDLPEKATVIVVQPITNWGALSGLGLGTLETYSKKEIIALQRWVEQGGQLVIFASAQNQLYDKFNLNTDTVPKNENEDRAIATPVSFLPVTAQAKTIELESRLRLTPANDDWIPLYASKNGLVAAVCPVKKGSVTAIGDPFLVSNSGINKADNAVFLGSLIRQSSGPIIFDEARHGLVEQQNLMSYLRRYNLHLVFFQALIIYALIWWASSARSGRIRAPHSSQHIESREFLSALANIYGKARLQGYALHWFEQRLVLALRHIFHDSELRSVDDADIEQVSLRLREIGVSNFRGFEAYMTFRKALLSRSKSKIFAEDGQVLWDNIKNLPEKEFVALAQLAIQLEGQWLGHGGIQSGDKLLLDAAQRNQLTTTPKKKKPPEAAQDNAEATETPSSDTAEDAESSDIADGATDDGATDDGSAPGPEAPPDGGAPVLRPEAKAANEALAAPTESIPEQAKPLPDADAEIKADVDPEVHRPDIKVLDNQRNDQVPEGKDDDGDR
ncbi:MAG: DUF4350 domain-containing protein [Planctomycetota bacterium]|nr:DUF4350 domain-containing protein [Planctomycetota bacterium]